MDRFEEAIFPRRELFGRALLRLVNLADQRGVSLRVDEFRAVLPLGESELSYELQLFGRTVVRRIERGRVVARFETYDFEQGLDLFERAVEEAEG
ncbi:MAG: hypothetical protein RMM58_07880 [Chloroflexota bacterium]|nr:hypothetical protein [Dehalococcoidia bacterium]MDW8253780.1 hypothetical protein [Chloroflexota bacterium]